MRVNLTLHKLRIWLRTECVCAAFKVLMVCVAIVLPLDFLAQIDAFVRYLRPGEILIVFA